MMRSKVLLAFSFFLLISLKSFGIDQPGQERVNNLVEKAKKLLLRYPDSSFQLLEEAYTIADQIDFNSGKFGALIKMSNYYNLKNELEKSYAKVMEAYHLAKKENMEDEVAYACNHLSNYFNTINQLDSSGYYLHQADQIAKVSKDTQLMVNTLTNWAEYYYSTKDTQAVEAPILASVNLAEQVPDQLNVRFYIYLAIDYYSKTHQAAKRAGMVEKYLASASRLPRLKDQYEFYHQEILTLGYDDDPDKLIEKLERDQQLHFQNDNFHGAFFGALFLAKQYEKLGDFQKAEASYQQAVQMNYTKDRPIFDLQANKAIAEFYRNHNQPANALTHYLRYDSLMNMEVLAETKALETKYRTAEKEAQLAEQRILLTRQAADKTRLTYALLASGALALIALAFLWYRTRNNQLLQSKNDTIQKSLEEKEILLKEIHHRVKNNLQVISGLLKWQSSFIKDSKALNAFNEGQNRVQSMAIIHQKLYQTDNLTGIEMGDYIDRLSQSLFHSYNINARQVNLKTNIEPLHLDIDTVIPLGLILNELISNALKHAFPADKEGGEIVVKLHQDEREKLLMLSVEDNGVGMDSAFAEKQKQSFGWELIETLTKKLKAQLIVKNEGGTIIQLRIKNYKIA